MDPGRNHPCRILIIFGHQLGGWIGPHFVVKLGRTSSHSQFDEVHERTSASKHSNIYIASHFWLKVISRSNKYSKMGILSHMIYMPHMKKINIKVIEISQKRSNFEVLLMCDCTSM